MGSGPKVDGQKTSRPVAGRSATVQSAAERVAAVQPAEEQKKPSAVQTNNMAYDLSKKIKKRNEKIMNNLIKLGQTTIDGKEIYPQIIGVFNALDDRFVKMAQKARGALTDKQMKRVGLSSYYDFGPVTSVAKPIFSEAQTGEIIAVYKKAFQEMKGKTQGEQSVLRNAAQTVLLKALEEAAKRSIAL